MRPTRVTLTAAGISAPIVVNWAASDFKIGFGVDVNGTLTYSVQHCFEDPAGHASATAYNDDATWFDHTSIAAQTTDKDGNYAYPIRAVRLNVTAFTSGT